MKRISIVLILIFGYLLTIMGQANGKLQLHFVQVGQGDFEILISPNGEVVLFDDGVLNHCDLPLSYLEGLGIKEINYQVTSHYHADHIGCPEEIFEKFPLAKNAKVYDRGFSNKTTVYKRYINAIGNHRRTAFVGEKIKLDSTSKNAIIIEFLAMNGAGIASNNENDLSLATEIHFGKLDIELAGDISGVDGEGYKDIESVYADKVGKVEVYKVHHHGSRYSSNANFLNKISPKVGIISASSTIGIDYKHPTEECMDRLHEANIKVYLTENTGSVLLDPAFDVVGGNIVIQSEPQSDVFTVSYNKGAKTDTYKVWEVNNIPNGGQADLDSTFVWSKNSKIYHYKTCSMISNIKQENKMSGTAPPSNGKLHSGCPK